MIAPQGTRTRRYRSLGVREDAFLTAAMNANLEPGPPEPPLGIERVREPRVCLLRFIIVLDSLKTLLTQVNGRTRNSI